MAYDLAAIRTKIRRLTKSPSTDQISDVDINGYIDNFYLYEFPSTLNFLKLKDTFIFYTKPNIDTYDLTDIDGTNYLNKYVTFKNPVYIDGYKGTLFTDKDSFYGMFPKVSYTQKIGTGDGVAVVFTGTLTNKPIVAGTVVVSAKQAGAGGHTYTDIYAYDDGVGGWTGDIGIGVNAINYETGLFSITLSVAPANGTDVNFKYLPYVASKPNSILYNESKFIMRPVPDQVYRIEIGAYKRPTSFALDTDKPELIQWWEYIAIGAAKKILFDRLDMDTLQIIEPEFLRQQLLINRRTIEQLEIESTNTIFANQARSNNTL
jgi:hypothetical protein